MSFKTLYKLLCGGTKFDVNTVVNADQFLKFVRSLAAPEDNAKMQEHIEYFEKGVAGEPPFDGDLENEIFVKIVENLRKFQLT